MRGAAKTAYHIRERFLLGCNRPTAHGGVSGGRGQSTRTQTENERKHRAAFGRSLTRARPCATTRCTRVSIFPASTRVQPHGRAVGQLHATQPHDTARPCAARPAPEVRSCFPDAARDRSTDYVQINIYQRPRERGPIFGPLPMAGQQPRQVPHGASGSATRIAYKLVCQQLGKRAPMRPAHRCGAGVPGGGAGCCNAAEKRRPMNAQQRTRWTKREGPPDAAAVTNITFLIIFIKL